MHIILGLLGTIVTILILLNRLAEAGIDLGGLNPFLWYRRRQWRQKYGGDPIFQLESPMEATALLMAAVAKMEGDISAEQKRVIIDIYESEFHLSKRDACALLVASTHILGNAEEVRKNVSKVLAPSLEAFTGDQARSCTNLVARMAEVDGAPTELQKEFLADVETALRARTSEQKSKWT